MRDDIHRRLSLPPSWKRVVKACTRDAEISLRGPRAAQALAADLRAIRPAVIHMVIRTLAEGRHALLPSALLRSPPTPCNSDERSFWSECAAAADARPDPQRYVDQALLRVLHKRRESMQREIRAQSTVSDPRDAPELVNRLAQACSEVDAVGIVRSYLAGDAIRAQERAAIDLDDDLRGRT